MENADNQNPYAAPSSPANQQESRVSRSNECLWIGIVSVAGNALAYGLPYCFDNHTMGCVVAFMIGCLLYPSAVIAGLAGVAIGGREALAQLFSESIYGQTETVFLGFALSIMGVVIPIALCVSFFFSSFN